MYKINKGLIYAKAENIYIIEEIVTRIYMCIPYCIWTTVIKMNTHINGITGWAGRMPWITFPLRQNFREDHLPSKCDRIIVLKFRN